MSRKLFILIALLCQLPFYSNAQTTFEVQTDTVEIYEDGYFYILNGLLNKTSSPLTYRWRVIQSNYPVGVRGTACICDNMNCHKDSTNLFAGTEYESTYPSGFGELYFRSDMTLAPSPGTYIFQLAFINKFVPTDSASQTYIIHKGTAAAPQLNGSEEVSVFPNPASKEAMLSLGLKTQQDIQVKIVDAAGCIVCSMPTEVRSAGKHIISLPVSNFTPGIYTVLIQTGSGVLTQKLNVLR